MKAMILAAGLGTRLRPLTNDIPKPMVPVLGIPNIERIVLHLREQGITDFAVNLHYCPEPLRAYMGDGSRLGVHIEFFYEPEILGTGGGIRNMLSHMGTEPCIVVNGDVLFMPRIEPLVAAHQRSGALASMVVRKSSDAEALGAVGLDADGRVNRLVWAGDQQNTNVYMFTGMHIVEPTLVERLPENGCIVRQCYIPMVEHDDALFGIVENTFFCDLGTPSDYLEAHLQIARGEVSLPGFVPQKDGNVISPSTQIAESAIVENSVIDDHVRVEKNIRVKDSVVMAGAVVTDNVTRKIVLSDGTEMI
ncbi:MAG: NDP-sugar synthase [Deltaproteobacteria bacterium]|nr:NDP-sugar synthase [Deltaproteobacteria bacterium]MBN2674540.1 NDP-sugar synthase [Deltaproteobacteria bacterium]